jgi:hypothetical protein
LRRKVYLGFFILHFALLMAVCCRDLFRVLAQGSTVFHSSLYSSWHKGERIAAAASGQTLASSNPLRQTLTGYLHCSGIDGAYSFFAPGIPSGYKLVFEIKYSDGHTEYDLPHVKSSATAVRLSTMLDYVGRIEYEPLRELMFKMLSYSIWQLHPGAVKIRAIFGYIDEPNLAEVTQGKATEYRFLYAYDFDFINLAQYNRPK